jgi:phosphohistidine phosphatase SixA
MSSPNGQNGQNGPNVTNVTSLVVSHQNRMRCLFDEIISNNMKFDDNDANTSRDAILARHDDMPDYSDAPLHAPHKLNPNSSKMYKFMNTAIVKMEVTHSSITLELVYNGEIGESEHKPKNKYFVRPVSPGTASDFAGRVAKKDFQTVDFPPLVLSNHMFDMPDVSGQSGQSTYTFYIVRHGQGAHNVVSSSGKLGMVFSGSSKSITDPSLTELGQQQAGRSGAALSALLGGSLSNVKYMFVSDLKRTHQTMRALCNQVQANAQYIMTVLPCSHEFGTYVGNGQKCDGGQYPAITPENNTSYVIKPGPVTDTVYNSDVDWSVYTKFYDGTRSSSGPNHKQCRDNNMISTATNLIDNGYSAGSLLAHGGGRRNHKRNTMKKRKRRKRKSQKSQKSRKSRKSQKSQKSQKKRRGGKRGKVRKTVRFARGM